MAIVEPGRIDGPAARLGIGENGGANRLDPPDERRDVARRRRFRLGHGRDHPIRQIIDEIDEEVARSHRRVADPELQEPFRRVVLLQARERPLPFGAGARQTPGLRLEGVDARPRQRPDRFLDDQPDEFVGRVVAARILAGEAVPPDGNLAVLADEFLFEQPFVDGAELPHAEIAVVDVTPALGRPLERERVDDVGHRRVAEPDGGQQRGAAAVEQRAVVGRQADGGVALVDGAAQIVDRRPIARRSHRKRVAGVLAAADVAPHAVAQRVIVVARIPDRQQIAILGIEDEQEPVEQDQRGLPRVRQRGVRGGIGDGAGEVRKHLSEDETGQARGDPLPVKTAFVHRAPMKRAIVVGAGQEARPPEHEREHLQPMAARRLVEREQAFVVAGKAEDRREIDLEELLGDGKRALPVETPPRAVGEDSPADPARRQVVHAAKVAEHLGGRRRLRLLAAPSRPAIERAKPALRFDDGETEPVAPPFADDAVGAALRRVVGEQQPIGNVLATARRKVLLTQARGPPESFENRPDQVFLGLALVGRSRDREIVEQVV